MVGSRWSRGLYAGMKCMCFCYLGLELALTRGPIALIGGLTPEMLTAIRNGAIALTSATAAFCFVRAIPVLVEGWQFIAASVSPVATAKMAVAKVSVRKTA